MLFRGGRRADDEPPLALPGADVDVAGVVEVSGSGEGEGVSSPSILKSSIGESDIVKQLLGYVTVWDWYISRSLCVLVK